MASIITGLFTSQSQSRKIAADLEDAGFQDSNYIMYLHNDRISKEVKTSIWQHFFRDNTKLEDDSLVISVKIKNAEQFEKAEKIFSNYHCIRENFFENIKFRHAKSLEYLKRIISIRARSEIASMPGLKHHLPLDGINSEVAFGKAY